MQQPVIEKKENKTAAIIEARMGSARLPGKHMLLANGSPMLAHLIRRLKSIPLIDEVVVATTKKKEDDVLVKLASEEGASYFRGSETDVLSRVFLAAKTYGVDVICEVTGDCPIIDCNLVINALETYFANDADYVNNGRHGLPGGMNSQVFSIEALKKASIMATSAYDREHVTTFFKSNPGLFKLHFIVAMGSVARPDINFLLDTEKDYHFLRDIIEHFSESIENVTCQDLIQYVDRQKA